MSTKKSYVVWGCQQLRNGREEWAKVVPTLEAALAIINKDRVCQDSHTFRLFELGIEIPLERGRAETPQPPKVQTVYRVKGR